MVLNLLDEVARPACTRTAPRTAEDAPTGLIRHTTDNERGAATRCSRARCATLVGGTAWLWSRDDMGDAVDVLVIDEAGQFSLANAVAVAPAASSLVLLGDPQQLTQPTKASTPTAPASRPSTTCIGEPRHDVIPADRGVFLDRTYRMHPSLTAFVSELAYEGRLESAPAASGSRSPAPGALSGDGLRWVPVDARGCSADSTEEAAVVARASSPTCSGGSGPTPRGSSGP